MTGKTHRLGGVVCCLVGYSILESKGMLIKDVSPLLQLTVMYPFSIYGSIVSDLDHHWESTPSKDIFSFWVNKVLHLTTGLSDSVKKKIPVLKLFDAKHRSWQTHSDLFLFLLIYFFTSLMSVGSSGSVYAQQVIMMLVFSGLMLGILSHVILDMLTPEGIWCIIFVVLNKLFKVGLPKKIRLVPRNSFFATDGGWENLIRKVLWLSCFILSLRIVYIVSPYKIAFQ